MLSKIVCVPGFEVHTCDGQALSSDEGSTSC